MDIQSWIDALDDMGAAASHSSLWLHWSLCPALEDQAAKVLFQFLIATMVAVHEASRECNYPREGKS